ncbi:MAG: bifunctional hydroxymethylpyrimidine kinase/phosphomethylpyrimidine kinase [Lactobacillaceae bacterium]|jgi:hydroxymethylpyrimidine/phosphomethylpyrimidine kinase|nr:bifunctional hydroxymethylpyrimidine kinase/phosphomethylpyrimidine kinase [Lactobacillaceae bacterium]
MIEVPQVVTIAGIDSSGGAGVNADLKTFHNQHVYAASIIVGLTAQNTYGVQALAPTDLAFLDEQFKSVAADLSIQAAKTGALFDAEHVVNVATNLKKYAFGKLVVDPVMVAKGGAKLLSDEAIEAVRTKLLPLAFLATPNLAEAAVLVGHEIKNQAEMEAAAYEIQALGTQNVLIKGGHLVDDESTQVSDFILFADGTSRWLRAPRIDTVRTHGTGDTISAYITANLAKGQELKDIIDGAKEFITAAIAQTINVGHGHGPLNHWV